MLNLIAIYIVCLYVISLAIKRTEDNLVINTLLIVIVCLMGGFFYYCAVFLALGSINSIGYIALTLFPVYLGLKK